MKKKNNNKTIFAVSFLPFLLSLVPSGMIVYASSAETMPPYVSMSFYGMISKIISLFIIFITAIAIANIFFVYKKPDKYDVPRNFAYTLAGLAFGLFIVFSWYSVS